MNNTQLIKEYTIKELQDLSKNYKLCMIEGLNGIKLTTWNPIKIPIKDHFNKCVERFCSKITPDGYYYFCFSQAVRFNKDGSTKYLIKKGTPPQLEEKPHNEMQNNKNDLLSVTSALAYITQIAELRVSLQVAEMELKRVKDENAVLEAEIEEYEREEGLSDNKTNGITEYLKETAPSLMALADRYFEHQDKKLNLEQQRIDKGINTPIQKENPPKQPIKRNIKVFESGSEEHLNYIRLLYNNQNEEQLNKELNKIEITHPIQYQNICNELNLFEDESNDEQ